MVKELVNDILKEGKRQFNENLRLRDPIAHLENHFVTGRPVWSLLKLAILFHDVGKPETSVTWKFYTSRPCKKILPAGT